MKKIGVLTSGGDSPGMNAAIRGVVRAGILKGVEVYGINDGYLGLYQEKIKKLDRFSVSDIINRGGTFLGSARFPEFKDPKIRKQAADILKKYEIEGLVVLGGDGSYTGAKILSEEHNISCIGIPCTIDNDIAGTDFTIGFHTALNTVLENIDKLRDTSTSHKRISIVEVMGRYCGDLTLNAGIAGGCEYIIVPEVTFDKKELIENIKKGMKKGKRHAIVAITELVYDVHELAKEIEKEIKLETRATVLGHIQRGGSPVATDRIIASRMGIKAVELLLEGKKGRCVGIINNEIVDNEIEDALKKMKKPFRKDLYEISKLLY